MKRETMLHSESDPLIDRLSDTLRPRTDDRRLTPRTRALHARLSERLIEAGHPRSTAVTVAAWLAGVEGQTIVNWRRALDLDDGDLPRQRIWPTLLGDTDT